MSAPAVAPTLPAKPVDRFKWVFTAVVAVLVVWAAAGLDIKWSRLLEAPADMWTLARLMFTQIDWSDFPDLVAAMWQSISMAWLGTLIAAGFAVPLAFLAAENLVAGPIAWVVRQVFNILRAVPEIILALAFIPLFGLTAMAGVMAIAVGSIGTLGKLFYEIIEGVGAGPLEAADAVGSSPVQRLRWGVLPQMTPEMAAFVLYRFEVNIRASAVMGLVGAGGIGADLAQALQFKEYGRAGLGLIIVVAGTIAVDVVSGLVRRRIVAGRPAALEDDDAGEVYVP